MSDVPVTADGALPSSHLPYDRPPRRALAEMPAQARTAWRERCGVQGEAELRVQAILDRAEAAPQAAGTPATIRSLWIMLADRAGTSGDADLKAAAALAGMAMGLRVS